MTNSSKPDEIFANKPKTPGFIYELASNRNFVTPDAMSVPRSSLAYTNASGSLRSYSTSTSNDVATDAMPLRIISTCAAVSRRHAVNFSISAVRSRASAASFVACAAIVLASATFSSDRRCNSYCRLNPSLLKRISLATPNATNESATTAPQIPSNDFKRCVAECENYFDNQASNDGNPAPKRCPLARFNGFSAIHRR